MRLPGDTRPQPPGGAARVIVRPDAVDENRLALDVPRPQREDLLIRRRVIPGARLRHIGKLDHDDGSRPGTFPRVHLAAVNQKPATEWVHGLLDPLDVGKHLGVDVRGTQMGDGVRAHKSSIDQVSVRPSCYRRRVASITHEVSALGGGDGNAADVAPLERGAEICGIEPHHFNQRNGLFGTGARVTSRTGRGASRPTRKSSSARSATTVSIRTVKPKSTRLLASEHMLRLQSSSCRNASSAGSPMNPTRPLRIIWFTSSPLT